MCLSSSPPFVLWQSWHWQVDRSQIWWISQHDKMSLTRRCKPTPTFIFRYFYFIFSFLLLSYISHQTDPHFSDISIIILRSENPEWYISTYYTKIWEYTTQNRYISLLKAIAIITIKQADIWMLHTLGGGPPVGQVRQGDVIKDRISAESNCLDIPSVHQKEIHLVSRGEAPGGGRM